MKKVQDLLNDTPEKLEESFSIWDLLRLLEARGVEAWVDFGNNQYILCFKDGEKTGKIPQRIGESINKNDNIEFYT